MVVAAKSGKSVSYSILVSNEHYNIAGPKSYSVQWFPGLTVFMSGLISRVWKKQSSTVTALVIGKDKATKLLVSLILLAACIQALLASTQS